MYKIIEFSSFKDRLNGLMFKKNIPRNIGFLFKNCKCIHTCFMKSKIHVYGLNEEYIIVDSHYHVKPYRLIVQTRNVKHTIEMSERSKKLKVGECYDSMIQF